MKINLLFRVRAGYVPFALLQLLLLFWVATGSAQNVSVTGTVSDAQGVLPGVNVQVKNKLVAATTDASGVFQITALPEDTLVFSFIGYGSQEIRVGAQTKFTVLLQPDETALDEVLVNAGYYKVKDKERTGSIAKITAKEIENQPVSNVLATMQGRMAGVFVTQQTGIAGGGFDIQIRGQNSLRAEGNAPLYIVDGVPYSSEAIGYTDTTIVLPREASPLSTISPTEIESIEILKDADATAIYGSRGANGVVLITTKKGKKGKTKYSATLSKGFGKVTRFMDLMGTEQYIAMRKEAFANDNITEYPFNAYDINGTWDQSRYTDWQDVLIGGTSEISDIQASVSGGSDKTQFLVSGNFREETTVFPGDFKFDRGNVRVNINHASADNKFKINFSGGYTVQQNDLPAIDLTRLSRTLAPNAPALYDADGNLNWENGTWSNPLAELTGTYGSKTNNLISNSLLSYEITDDFSFRTSIGYTQLQHSESRTIPSTLYNPNAGVGSDASSLYLTTSDRNSWVVEPQLNWKKQLGESVFDVLAGATMQHQTSNQLVLEADGFSSNSLIHSPAAAAAVFVIDNSQTKYNYQAFYGRVNYNYAEKYILNLTGRRDGSSRFGPGKQFAYFGAVGAAWLFGKESLFDNSVLSFGKLRGSYGSSGNDQIGDYQFLDTYSVTGNNYQGIVGLQPTQLFNPNFGWETNKKLEIALETGFFKDRIFLTAALYRNRSSNQLVGVPLPGSTGFTSLQANLDATVENRGFEFTLRGINFQRKDFSWTTNFNISVAANELLSFPDLENSTYKNQYVIGEPLNIKLVYHYTGIDPDTGVYQFEDVNGDGMLNSSYDKKTVKNLNPAYFGGLQNQLVYKRWSLDFLFQFVKQEAYNASNIFSRPGQMSNQPSALSSHWQEAGDSATYQMFSSNSNSPAGKAYGFYQSSDAAISDASYVRLKNISISYNVPERWLFKTSCRLFLQGQNLLTFTNYKGADPEFKNTNSVPPLRVWSLGAQLTF